MTAHVTHAVQRLHERFGVPLEDCAAMVIDVRDRIISGEAIRARVDRQSDGSPRSHWFVQINSEWARVVYSDKHSTVLTFYAAGAPVAPKRHSKPSQNASKNGHQSGRRSSRVSERRKMKLRKQRSKGAYKRRQSRGEP